MAESILFYVIAACAVAMAVLMVIQRNPLMSALYLVGNFFCVASLYLLLRAQFLAVIQIVVYTGAIMVLVIFVIMLLNLGDENRLAEPLSVKKIAGSLLILGFLAELVLIIVLPSGSGPGGGFPGLSEASSAGSVESVGDALFARFLLPFEATSLLLLAAIVGAVILAKKRI